MAISVREDGRTRESRNSDCLIGLQLALQDERGHDACLLRSKGTDKTSRAEAKKDTGCVQKKHPRGSLERDPCGISAPLKKIGGLNKRKELTSV
jgi:hypothetical protein